MRNPIFGCIVQNTMGEWAVRCFLFLCLAGGMSAQISPNRVILSGHMHPRAKAEYDRGRAESSLYVESAMIMLKPSAAQQADLDQLLAQQQDPSSPHYHQWLTPEQYAARFGAAQADIGRISAWLTTSNLTVMSVARGQNEITRTGNVRDVENAFGIQIHRYNVNGESHFANAADPSVPASVSGLVASIHGLNDFKLKARAKRRSVKYTSGSSGFLSLSPDDIGALYDIKPLWNAGITGAGQKIVVVGQSAINISDIESFRSFFNLPANDPTLTLVPGSRDPGILSKSGDEGESDLDLEFAGAVAKDASVIFVYSTNVDNSLQYAIDQNLAPVISMSLCGDCEVQTTNSGLNLYQALANQANTQGISWMAASGDSGAADCYNDNLKGNTGAALAVDAPGSTPGVTAVGGTELNPGTGSYFAPANDANHSSLATYVPEMVWNDSIIDGDLHPAEAASVRSSASRCGKTGTGVPADGFRDVPDVSFAASADIYPLLFYTDGAIGAVGGTSVAAPTFSGIVALLNQSQKSSGLGNINPRLYAMAATVPAAFHDVTVGSNVVNGCAGVRGCTAGNVGYNAGVGYDQASGLGSVDAYNLITFWSQTSITAPKAVSTVTLTSSASSLQASGNVTLTATVAGSAAAKPSGTVNFIAGGATIGTSTLTNSTGSLTIAASTLAVGFDSITAEYSGDANYAPAAASLSFAVVSPTVMSIQGVTNAASYNQAFSSGEIAAVFGTLLAGSTASAPAVPLPTSLAGVSVTVNGIAAPLYFVSPGQINFQIPYGISSGIAAPVTVTYNNQTVTSYIPMSAYSPGIFVDSTGAPAGAQTAKRGSTVAIYITGQGAVSPQPANGAFARRQHNAHADQPGLH